MQKNLFLFIFSLISACPAFTQPVPESDSYRMVLVNGGTTVLGGDYQYEIRNNHIHYLGHDRSFDSLNSQNTALGEIPAPNNPTLQVTVADFYLSPTEVTNREYREFLIDSLLSENEKIAFRKLLQNPREKELELLSKTMQKVYKEAGLVGLMPKNEVWRREFGYSYSEPLAVPYFQHPAFDEYPVVGISWIQAKIFCGWLSRANNATRLAKNLPSQPDFRLPTEMEWEFACRGVLPLSEGSTPTKGKKKQDGQEVVYPWPGNRVIDKNGKYRANIRTESKDYDDEYPYTAPVTAYDPNKFGLYNMAGNVSEWVEDVFRINEFRSDDSGIVPDYGGIDVRKNPRVIKGGSWADFQFAAMCGSRSGFYQNEVSARVGFRVAMTKVD
jgi:formylglycine-generating enzyme required for sulfatase activity